MDVVIASGGDLKSKHAAIPHRSLRRMHSGQFSSGYIGNLRVYQTGGRLLFLAVRHDDIYRANVQEKLKQLEVTALLKEETI